MLQTALFFNIIFKFSAFATFFWHIVNSTKQKSSVCPSNHSLTAFLSALSSRQQTGVQKISATWHDNVKTSTLLW